MDLTTQNVFHALMGHTTRQRLIIFLPEVPMAVIIVDTVATMTHSPQDHLILTAKRVVRLFALRVNIVDSVANMLTPPV